MGYTDPGDAVTGAIAPAVLWNTGVRDNMRALGQGSRHIHAGTTDLEIWHPCCEVSSAATTTVNPAANTLVAVPFFPRRAGVIDRIAFEVTTALAGNGRAGIYESKSATNVYPGNLVVDGGSISTSTTGVKSTTISSTLTSFVCWAVYVQSAAAAIRAVLRTNLTPLLGMASTMGTTWRSSLTVAFTFAALPSTFPGSATFDASSDVALIAARYSA